VNNVERTQPYIAGAVQWAPEFLDPERGAEKAEAAIDEAARMGVRLLVFPEAWLLGYPYFSGITPSDPEYQAFRQVLFERAVRIDGPEIARIRKAAAAHRMTVVIGLNERVGSTICCSLAYIGADGRLLGSHRKLVPTQAERLVWGCGDGSDLEVYDTALGRLGGLNCFEHQMAPARYVLCEMGEQVHAAAWPGHAFIDGIVDASTRHLAHENGCFVVVAREVMTPDRVAAGLPRPDKTAAHFQMHGGSAIIAPGGDYLAGPVFDTETIVTAEIDLARIGVIKWFFDGTGHYARPDVFQLHFDRRAKRPVVYRDPPEA
jgi:predicted amidohydrolase